MLSLLPSAAHAFVGVRLREDVGRLRTHNQQHRLLLRIHAGSFQSLGRNLLAMLPGPSTRWAT